MTQPIADTPDYAIGENSPHLYPPTLRAVRHLIGFLQWRFSLAPVGAFHWEEAEAESPDTGSSEIWISAETPIPTRTVGERPAITVARAGVQFQGVGLGDVVDHSWATGGKARMDLLPTTLTVNVLSKLPTVAERLAWIVQDQIFSMREEIVRTEKCIFAIGQRSQLPPPSPAAGLVDQLEEEWTVVPIFLPAYLQHITRTIPLNVPVLKKINSALVIKGDGDKR